MPETRNLRVFDDLAGAERMLADLYWVFAWRFADNRPFADFWRDMALDESQHASVLLATKEILGDVPQVAPPSETATDKIEAFKLQVRRQLAGDADALTVDEALRVAIEFEGSEMEVIYRQLLNLGGPRLARVMEDLIVPVRAQRKRLKEAVARLAPRRRSTRRSKS
jgi:hypothetical protein